MNYGGLLLLYEKPLVQPFFSRSCMSKQLIFFKAGKNQTAKTPQI